LKKYRRISHRNLSPVFSIIKRWVAVIFLSTILLIPCRDLANSDIDENNDPNQGIPLLGFFFQSKETKCREQMRRAKDSQENLDYAEAIRVLNAVIKEGPPLRLLAEARYRRGYLYELIGDDESAMADLEIAINAFPSFPILKDGLYRLGEIYYRTGDFTKAGRLLSDAMHYFPDDLRHQKAIFQMGYIAQEEGKKEFSAAMFDSFITIAPDLADFGIFQKAQSEQAAGDYSAALLLYQEMQRARPDSPLFSEASLEIAFCYLFSGDYARAEKELKRLRGGSSDKIKFDYYLAVCAQNQGLREEALRDFRRIVSDYPKNGFARHALSKIKVLTDGKFSPMDYYHAGAIRFHRRELRKAAANFNNFIKKSPDNPLVKDARLMLGRVYHRQEKYKKAISSLKVFLKNAKDHPRRSEGIYYLANSYVRHGQHLDAIEQFEKLLSEFPKCDYADDALHETARSLESLAQFDKARKIYQQLWKTFPKRALSQKVHYEIGLNFYMDGQYQEAERVFSQIADSNPGMEMEQTAIYWLAKSYFAEGDFEKGKKSLERLKKSYPNSYYFSFDEHGKFIPDSYDQKNFLYSKPRQMAASDLILLENWLAKQTADSLVNRSKSILYADSNFKKGEIFTSLDMRGEAKKKFKQVESAFKKDAAALCYLLGYYLEHKYYLRSMVCARNIANATDPDHIPDFLHRFIYPLHYPELISAAAEKYDIDPLFVCALIRQESMFEAQIASRANAQGLMQIIPSTGKYIAKELGVEDFRLESLHSPKRSLDFGLWYLSDISSKNENRLPRALAGYNGGPGNIRRWTEMTVTGGDDMLSEKITYRETRKYVKRILSHYLYYQQLWGDSFIKEPDSD